MTDCKQLLRVVGRTWALLAIVGTICFAFGGWTPWVVLSHDPFGVLRGLTIAAVYIIGLCCAVNYVNDCK